MEEREFHLRVGGRVRRDLRFVDNPVGAEIRELLAEEKEAGMPMVRLAKELKISASTLSMAAGGRLNPLRLEKIRDILKERSTETRVDVRELYGVFQS